MGPAPSPPAAYPVRLDAQLDDAHLSRGLWLVKWVLVIPHVVVLFFLWIAVFVLTIVAGFAILSTGRYPRRIFRFQRRRHALDVTRDRSSISSWA